MKKHEEPIKFLKDLKKYWRGDTTLDYMLKVYGEVQKGIARGGIMKRQAMNVSVNELRELADDLERQTREFNLELSIENLARFDKRWQISIINKTPECSDTWEFEDTQSNEDTNKEVKK